tara:strand:- start:162 stop:614 length:453 start_codon:yes stop_codon:yes gene_type:complete
MSWIYKDKEFLPEHVPEGAEGFIYLMKATIDGRERLYIGKKNFHSKRNVKKGKRELEAMTDKRGSKKKKVIKLSYENYFSSSEALSLAHKSGIHIERTILHICNTKRELTYQEARYMFKNDVLENDIYLNGSILSKFFRVQLEINNPKYK